MSWTAFITSTADRHLKRLPQDAYARIRTTIDKMELNPWSGDIEKLEGTDHWRRRVGNYRIKFRLLRNKHLLYIYEIERRTSTTY